MKKLYTRMAACSLAVLIAFNTVAIPKAEASMSMLSVGFSTALSAYLNGIGFTIDAKCGGSLEDIAYDVREWHENTIMPIWEKYEKAIDATFDYATLIANGVNMSVSKQVRFSPELCSIFSDFVSWLISTYSLETAEEPVTVHSISGFQLNGQYFDPVVYTMWENSPVSLELGVDYTTGSGLSFRLEQSDGVRSFYVNDVLCNTTSYSTPIDYYAPVLFSYGDVDDWFRIYGWSQSGSEKKGVMNWDVGYNSQPLLTFLDVFGPYSDDRLTAMLSSSYAGTPYVAEGKEAVIVLPADSDISTWEDFRTYVAQQDLEGVYTPEAVTIEDAQTGATEGEDTEEDTTTIIGTTNGILDWTKKIWSSIQSIPQSIAEAIKGIFVPDTALTTEITDAFAAKFSFVPTLHRLGTDLLSIGPDSKPPVVYIHLEDAEGSIDYGGTVKALDMSWYQRYKEDGDRIIGGFLWLGFLWLLFKRVPAIINGGEMVQEYTAAIDRGSKRRKH